MNDSAVFLTIVGAIIGSVLGPIGDGVSRLFLNNHEKESSLHFALLLFLVASSLWVIGEALTLLGFDKASAGLIYLISAIILVAAYKHFNGKENLDGVDLKLPFKFLLVGNFIWLLAESTELMLYSFWDWGESLIPLYVRFGVCIFALGVFGIGIKKTWGTMPDKN